MRKRREMVQCFRARVKEDNSGAGEKSVYTVNINGAGRPAKILFFISVRDGEDVGQAQWGGGDSLKETPGSQGC